MLQKLVFYFYPRWVHGSTDKCKARCGEIRSRETVVSWKMLEEGGRANAHLVIKKEKRIL